jgi:hypothetical protein
MTTTNGRQLRKSVFGCVEERGWTLGIFFIKNFKIKKTLMGF